MQTAKRLYLYGVLGISLVPMLWGFADLLRVALRGLAATAGSREIIGADFVADEVSWALALVIVALPVWLLHAWLVRRSLSGEHLAAAEERATPARATYFFLVLLATGTVAILQLYEVLQQVLGSVLVDQRMFGLAGAVAGLTVAGVAWLGHVWWRRTDLRSAPARTSGDWLTRAYLYIGLFAVAVAATWWLAEIVAVIARELIGARTLFESAEGWRGALVTPMAGVIGASVGWVVQWSLAARLVRADPPMGMAHRASQTRTGYFLAVVFIAATTVLVLGAAGLQHVLAAILGVWHSSEGSRWIEEVGGPLVMTIPFLGAWWWHARRAAREARVFDGEVRRRAVERARRLTVAIVGLSGLAVGAAWELYALLQHADVGRTALFTSTALTDHVTPATATALVGLALWLPTWLRSQRDRATAPVEVVGTTSRRVYLLLVSATSVVAGMGALAGLVYEATRALLGAGPVGDLSWAVSVLVVAGVVLAYHLWQLRADAAFATPEPRDVEAASLASGDERREIETLVISAPAGADFDLLNAALRRELPEGYDLRVVGGA